MRTGTKILVTWRDNTRPYSYMAEADETGAYLYVEFPEKERILRLDNVGSTKLNNKVSILERSK